MIQDKNFFASLAGVDEGGEQEAVKSKIEPQYDAELVASSSKKPTKKEKEKDISVEVGEQEPDELEFDDVEGQLTIDVFQDEDNIYIESPVAGVEPDDVDVAITPESVVVKGKRHKKERVKKDDYLYQECFWGSFSRSVILPQEIDPDKASASLKNGVLKVTLPKVNRSKSKNIKVKID